MVFQVPLRCTRMTESNSSSAIEKIILSRRMPALFTRTSSLPERVDGGVDDALGAVEVGDVVVVGDRLAAAALDDVDDLVGGALVGALAGHRAAEVVHDDLGALVGELDRLAAADAVAGAGDDGDLAVEHAHLRVLLPALKTDVGVTVSRWFTRPSSSAGPRRRDRQRRMALDTSVIGKPTGAHTRDASSAGRSSTSPTR